MFFLMCICRTFLIFSYYSICVLDINCEPPGPKVCQPCFDLQRNTNMGLRNKAKGNMSGMPRHLVVALDDEKKIPIESIFSSLHEFKGRSAQDRKV